MNKIPTAEEFARREYDDDRHIDEFAERQADMKHAMWMMQQFAKLHVEAALKEALESIPCLGSSTDIATYEEVENAVLNAYPKTNIK